MSEQILCTNCNAPNPRDTVFCGKCGARLASAVTEGMAVDPLLGKMVGDRFLVQAKLGEGGMGVVYKAEQTAIGRTVALKVLHPHLSQDVELHARFQNEAAAASRLTHTNTITIYDFGRTSDGSLYIAMEFIKGRSLDEEIVKGGPLAWQRVAHLAPQICGSLQDAHDNSIVHRDLKPENVMLCDRAGDRDFVKVLDFGIAKILGDDSGDARKNLTKTGMVFGTPQYMSPEQIRGEKVDHRTDIYSVGCIFYEALAGVLPFTSETPMGVLTKHLMDPPPPLSSHALPLSVPRAVEDVVLSALAKKAEDRPQSMHALATAFLSAASAAGMSGPYTIQQPATPGAKAVATTAVVSPVSSPQIAASQPREGAMAPGPKAKGPSGALIGIIAAAALIVLGGGGAGWYFVLGPGAGSPSTQAVTTPQLAPPLMPPPVTPPSGYTPPAVAPASGGNTASLPAVPQGSGKTDPPRHTGSGGTKPKVGPDASCTYHGSGDVVAAAMSNSLRRQEAKVRACVQGPLAQTEFSFEVAKDSSTLDKLSVGKSSEMDGCLRPLVASSLSASSDKARTGKATFVLGREQGAVRICTIKVETQAKPVGNVVRPIEVKPKDDAKDKPDSGTKEKDTDSKTKPSIKIGKPLIRL